MSIAPDRIIIKWFEDESHSLKKYNLQWGRWGSAIEIWHRPYQRYQAYCIINWSFNSTIVILSKSGIGMKDQRIEMNLADPEFFCQLRNEIVRFGKREF